MSTFFKQIYRYTRPRSYRHNENFWPFFRITRAKAGNIIKLYYKGQKVPLTDWNYRCFSGDSLMIATGPSVRKVDLSVLPSMTVMGVNGAYVLKNKLDFQLYVIVDMSFIDRRTDVLQAIISDSELILFTTLHGIKRIIDYFTLLEVHCQLALIEDACYRIYQPQVLRQNIGDHFYKNSHIRFSSDYPNIAFSTDIRSGIFDVGTVSFWALQILFFLGFTRLYILGLDMTNFHLPRFYENDKNKLPSLLAEKIESIIIPAFALASKVFQQNGIEVKNLSLNSGLSSDIFKKVSFSDAF